MTNPYSKVKTKGENLAASHKDYAIFLPSTSSVYARLVSKKEYTREIPKHVLPNGLPDLDFTSPKSDLYYYPWSLYSAGHAALDPADSDTLEAMVQKRDRKKSVLIGDSGGFQAATGVLKYPWDPKSGQSDEDWTRDKDKFRLRILRWLEHTADYSMILDWPTFALMKFGENVKPTDNVAKHPKLKTFQDCLNGTIENADFFIKNRKEGATKMMNVLQGRNMEEGDVWWDVVKDWPFETWAFSSNQAANALFNLRRLIIMRDGGYLEGREWLHYLGQGKIRSGVFYTRIQRALREHVDPKLTVSFDAASPFISAGMGMQYMNWIINKKRLSFNMEKMVDDSLLKGSKAPLQAIMEDHINACLKLKDEMNHDLFDYGGNYFDNKDATHYLSPVVKRVLLGDMCIKGPDDIKKEKILMENRDHHRSGMFDFGAGTDTVEHFEEEIEKLSSLDAFSYAMVMNHNVYSHIRGIQEANFLMDGKDKAKYFDHDLIETCELVNEIFTTEKPMELIDSYKHLLYKVIPTVAVDQFEDLDNI